MFTEIEEFKSSDENVKKIVFTKENAVAEAVLYKYPTYEERTVICCSTQSGCPVGCRFCGTGDFFIKSLSAEEIIQQVDYCLDSNGIDGTKIQNFQIMVMSMGEPMLNYKELEKAFIELHKKYPNAKLLISTIGPKVDYEPLLALSEKIPTIGLQFSIHESTDELRNKLIPFKSKLNLKEIAEVGEQFLLRTGRQPFINYCATVKNNSQEDVDRVKAIFNPDVFQATVSVVCEVDESIQVSHERQFEMTSSFMEKMNDAGYSTRRFDPAGQDDIGGGCGQLWFVQDWIKNNQDKVKPSCGNGKPVTHS